MVVHSAMLLILKTEELTFSADLRTRNFLDFGEPEGLLSINVYFVSGYQKFTQVSPIVTTLLKEHRSNVIVIHLGIHFAEIFLMSILNWRIWWTHWYSVSHIFVLAQFEGLIKSSYDLHRYWRKRSKKLVFWSVFRFSEKFSSFQACNPIFHDRIRRILFANGIKHIFINLLTPNDALFLYLEWSMLQNSLFIYVAVLVFHFLHSDS